MSNDLTTIVATQDINNYNNYMTLSSLLRLAPSAGAVSSLDFEETPELWQTWTFGLLIITAASFLSPTAILMVPLLSNALYERCMIFLVALGIGAMSGSCIFILIPQAFNVTEVTKFDYVTKSWLMISSLYLFFLVDRILQCIIEFRRQRHNRHKVHASTIDALLARTRKKSKNNAQQKNAQSHKKSASELEKSANSHGIKKKQQLQQISYFYGNHNDDENNSSENQQQLNFYGINNNEKQLMEKQQQEENFYGYGSNDEDSNCTKLQMGKEKVHNFCDNNNDNSNKNNSNEKGQEPKKEREQQENAERERKKRKNGLIHQHSLIIDENGSIIDNSVHCKEDYGGITVNLKNYSTQTLQNGRLKHSGDGYGSVILKNAKNDNSGQKDDSNKNHEKNILDLNEKSNSTNYGSRDNDGNHLHHNAHHHLYRSHHFHPHRTTIATAPHHRTKSANDAEQKQIDEEQRELEDEVEVAMVNNALTRTFSTRKNFVVFKEEKPDGFQFETDDGSIYSVSKDFRRASTPAYKQNGVPRKLSRQQKEVEIGVEVHEKVVIEKSRLEVASVAYMIIFGSSANNFVDGMSTGAAFSDSIIRGITIGLAVLSQQFPQELGTLAILIKSGLGIRRTLLFNMLPIALSYVGFAFGVFLDNVDDSYDSFIFSISAGMYFYIFLGTLIPEIRESFNATLKRDVAEAALCTALQFSGIGFGVSFLYMMN